MVTGGVFVWSRVSPRIEVRQVSGVSALRVARTRKKLNENSDWVQLEKATGVRTNTFALEAMRMRCTDVALQCPDLEARGLPALRAKLRSTAPEAPRSAHRPPTLSPNLGTAAPLPLAQVAGSPSTVTGTIDQLEMQIDPNSSTVTETSRKRGSRGGRTDAERLRDWRKNRTSEQIEKGRQKDRDRKKAKRGGGASG